MGSIVHNAETVAEALNVDPDEAELVKRLVARLGERLKSGAKVSELLEEIWIGDRCSRLSLQAKIFATFLLGAEVQTTIILSLVSFAKGKGGGGGGSTG